MKHILIAASILILLMGSIGIASADQRYDWPWEKANEAPENMTHIFYDFEKGGSFTPYIQDLDTCEFVDVPSEYSYFGFDEPSYVAKGARAMHIHPYDYYYNPDGSPVDYIWIVNGGNAFAPRSMNKLGQYYPGINAKIVINESVAINYFSFLASTGCTLHVTIYDPDGNFLFYEKIYSNIYREGSNASKFTQFYVYFPEHTIGLIDLEGSYNAWHVDDMILGFSDTQPTPDPDPDPDPDPTPIPDTVRRDYGWAAERLMKMVGAEYLQYGTAWDYVIGDYRSAEEMMDDIPDPYFNFDYKQPELEFGIGINDQDSILFAFNGEGENLINWWDTNRMAKSEFTVVVEYSDLQPGDVFFIDYPQDFLDGSYGPDGCWDEIGMVIEPMIDDTGDVVNVIRIIPEAGVHYSTIEFVNALYSNSGFVEYRALPDDPKGGHKPYQKIRGKPI